MSLYQSDVKQVSVSDIRDELRGVWAVESEQSENAVIRARTHNLIVYYNAALGALDDAVQAIIKATVARPGRVILIYARDDDQDTMNSYVTTYCRTSGEVKVCGELIVLDVSGVLRDEVHSTVSGLLAAELPVYLWWLCVPSPSDHLFEVLSDEADHILFDSGMFPGADEVLPSYPLGESIGDLNWARLTPWRRQLAYLWDVHGPAGHLDILHSLDIHFHGAPGGSYDAGALLVLGWLASRLGWRLDRSETGEKGSYMTYWERGGQSFKAELMQREASAQVPAGALLGVFIQAGVTPSFVMPSIQYMPENAVLDVRENEGSPQGTRHAVPYQPESTANALAQELDFGYDPEYIHALRMVRTVIEAVQR